MDTQPLVSIRCLAFNHEPFIRQCLDGFVAQQTTFPFEIVVHEDASTDGTAAIIREYAGKYPELFRPIYQTENQYSKHDGSLRRIVHGALRGKYVAFCEGDDYWTDPLKLQKQVDYLEAHPDTGCVYTDFSMYHQESNRMEESLFRTQPGKFPLHSDLGSFICKPLYLAPCTWVFRRELLDEPIMNSVDGSFVLFAHMLSRMKVHFMPDTTAVYRLLSESASHSVSLEHLYARESGLYAAQHSLAERYGLSQAILDRIDTDYYCKSLQLVVALERPELLVAAWAALRGKRLKARHRFWLAISYTATGRWLIRRQFARRQRRHSR